MSNYELNLVTESMEESVPEVLKSPITAVIQTSTDLTLDSPAQTSGFFTTAVQLNKESPLAELSPLHSDTNSVPVSSNLSDIIKICEKHVFDQQNTVQESGRLEKEEKCVDEEIADGSDSIDFDEKISQEEDQDWTAHWAKKVKITLKRKGSKASKLPDEIEDDETSLDEPQFSDWEPYYESSEPEVKKKSKKKKAKGKSSRKKKESKSKAKDESEQGEFPCTLCKKICKTKDAHSKHEALHKCDICGLIMLSPGTIYDHKRSYHSGEKPFVCDICGSSFSTNPILKKHKINIHTEGRPFPCDQCQYGAKSLELLRRHKLVHSGEKKFQCDDCGACFPRAATLKEHVLIHKDVWPHHCQFCPKRFKNIRQLRRHEEVHLDQYKYQCKVCGKRMRQVGNLNTHMRTHNGEKPYACDKCGKRFAHNVTRKQHMESCFGNMEMLPSTQNLIPLPLPTGLQFPGSAIDCSGPSQHRF